MFLRVAQQNVSIFITFLSIRQFELTTVALVNNCATFVILILGWVILSEKASAFSVTTLALSFGGTILVLVGADAAAVTEKSGNYLMALLTLISNPFIIGAGVIAMRQMRKMHESVITTYMNLMLLIIMLTVVYASGSDLSPWTGFGWVEWMAIAGLAFSNVGS